METQAIRCMTSNRMKTNVVCTLDSCAESQTCVCINDRSMYVVAQLNQCTNNEQSIENHRNVYTVHHVQYAFTDNPCSILSSLRSLFYFYSQSFHVPVPSFGLCFSNTIAAVHQLYLQFQKKLEASSCTNQHYYKDTSCQCEFEYVFLYHVMIYLDILLPSIFNFHLFFKFKMFAYRSL